ncbi:MAG: translation initiation factor IF-2 [Bacilli bacterium]
MFMMNVLEYALDVNMTSMEILKLCKKLDIKATDDTFMLTDEDIILLDNEIGATNTDSVVDITEDEELEDKAESLAETAKVDGTSAVKKEKTSHKPIVKKDDKKSTEEFLKDKKELYKHREKLLTNEDEVNSNIVFYKEGMTVGELATVMDVSPSELIKKLMSLGVMTTLNNAIAYDVAEMLVVDYDLTLKRAETADMSNFEEYEIIDQEKDLIVRPPVITIMGHVDHGKTSLLDYIRKTSVASNEAGGITQVIGAYQITYNNKKLTFIDTPGHEAFTEMRARGASVTDIVIIIVAADDGIMPQTKEAIDHAKAAGVPIIVAINKMDKPNANPERVLTALSENGLTPEAWGGDTLVAYISAKTGEGINDLLDTILLVAEMSELKANPSRYATGAVIESRLDKQVGAVVSLLIQNGTLRLGDPIVIGECYGKVRTLKNDKGENIVEALPSMPASITGLNELPSAGDKFMAFETEKQARAISAERKTRAKELDTNKSGMSLDELFGAIKDGTKEINIVLKSDINGSSEAVKNSLQKIEVEDIRVNIIRSGVGTITESDIVLAKASNAIIIGFNVKPNSKTMEVALESGVEIRLYNIIYKVVEDMEAAMKGMLEPIYEEKLKGTAEIRQIFKFSKVGNIAGSHVLTGVLKNNDEARVIRDGIIIYTGKIKSIQHEKDQVKEVKKDMDCGLTFDSFQDIKEGDIVEDFQMIEIKR